MESSPSITDTDGDMQMNNTLEPPSTPPSQRLPIDLSPPDSQGGIPLQASSSLFNNVPTLPSGLSGANMNGKRPLDTLDGNVDSVLTAAPDTTCSIDDGLNGQTLPQGQTKTHPGSGYTWRRTEDAPGYSWQNRKAQDEATRAWENGIVNKDRSVGKRYADPMDMVANEQSVLSRSHTLDQVPGPGLTAQQERE